MKPFVLLPAGLAALMLCVNQTEAHSWVEKLLLIASNGTFVGPPGYPRGFVPRTSRAFTDFVSENQIPPDGRPTATEILPTDLMCKASQRVGNQTAGNPALVAAPGDNVALIYQENGHVTLLDRSPTKPVGSGTVFIYGTKSPSNSDTYLGIHRVWNTEGTGGDKRGKLLATRPFDDGQCYQNNTSSLAKDRQAKFGTSGNDLPCQTDFQLPQDAGTNGTYTLYWLWEWPTLDNATGKVITNQSYTTCMDVTMTPKKLANAGNFNRTQLVDSRAIENELSTAFLVNPTAAEQLTTTQGVAGSKSTSSVRPAFSSHTAPNSIGETVTVTVTAAPAEDAGNIKTKVVTITTTVCKCASVDSIAPFLTPALPTQAGQAKPDTTQTVQSATIATAPPEAPPGPNSINSASAEATTNSVPLPSQSIAGAVLAPSPALPVVQPFLSPNSLFIPGSSVTAISTASNAVPTNTPATAPATDSETSTTTSGAQCTKTAAGSRRRRKNRQTNT